MAYRVWLIQVDIESRQADRVYWCNREQISVLIHGCLCSGGKEYSGRALERYNRDGLVYLEALLSPGQQEQILNHIYTEANEA